MKKFCDLTSQERNDLEIEFLKVKRQKFQNVSNISGEELQKAREDFLKEKGIELP